MARRNAFPARSRASSGVSRDWGAGPGGTAPLAVTNDVSAILGAGVQTTGGELTLLRTRGILDLFITGAPNADGDGYFGAVGIAVASDQAFTAGIASLPSLLSE